MQFAGFLQCSWFSVFVNNDDDFSDFFFLPDAFYGFSGFAKEVTSRTRAKTVVPRDHFVLKECMTSLVFLVTVIWVVTVAKQTLKY